MLVRPTISLALCFLFIFFSKAENDVPAVEKEDSDVLVLTESNFDETIDNNDVVLAEFYAPWCGHCKTLEPEYKSAAASLKAKGSAVVLGKVDATVEKDLGSRFDVSGYPTLKFFIKGKPYDYEGPRDADGIVSYMEERSSSGWKPPAEAVIELLEEEAFDAFVNAEELSLVEFYAPWCGHCKSLAPEYEKAAKQLKEHDPSIPLIKVDATKAKALGERYGVQGFPTLKIFRKGKHSEYSGPRDANGIVLYMGRQSGNAVKEVTGQAKKLAEHLAILEDASIVGFFDSTDSPLYATLQEAGNDLRENYTMVYTLDAAARKKYRAPPNSVAVIQPERFREDVKSGIATLSVEDATVSELQAFFRDNELPLVGEFSGGTMGKRYYRRPLCLFFVTVDWSHAYRDMTQAWRRKFVRIAKAKKDVATFAMIDEEGMKAQFDEFGFGDSGADFNVGCYDYAGGKYPLEPQDEFDDEVIEEFVDSVISGEAKPHLKSQPIPKRQQSPVVTVVGKSFEKIVMDDSKDVLIELYAPWCGHCKKFEPEYKKLAKELKSEKTLVLTKMDATLNDAPTAYSASGFPTIYLAPAGDKKNPIKYSGDRQLSDLRKFIKEHSRAKKSGKEEL